MIKIDTLLKIGIQDLERLGLLTGEQKKLGVFEIKMGKDIHYFDYLISLYPDEEYIQIKYYCDNKHFAPVFHLHKMKFGHGHRWYFSHHADESKKFRNLYQHEGYLTSRLNLKKVIYEVQRITKNDRELAKIGKNHNKKIQAVIQTFQKNYIAEINGKPTKKELAAREARAYLKEVFDTQLQEKRRYWA